MKLGAQMHFFHRITFEKQPIFIFLPVEVETNLSKD